VSVGRLVYEDMRYSTSLLRAALHECFEGGELSLRYSDNSDVNDDVTEWL